MHGPVYKNCALGVQRLEYLRERDPYRNLIDPLVKDPNYLYYSLGIVLLHHTEPMAGSGPHELSHVCVHPRSDCFIFSMKSQPCEHDLPDARACM